MSEFAVDLQQESNRGSPRRWILSHLGRHGWLFVGMFIGAFGNAALAAAMPIFIGIAFDAALADPPHGSVSRRARSQSKVAQKPPSPPDKATSQNS